MPVGNIRLASGQGYPFDQTPHRMWRAFRPQPCQMIGIVAPGVEKVRFDHEAAICKLCAKSTGALGITVGNGGDTTLLRHDGIKIDKRANARRQPAGDTRNDHAAIGMADENDILEILPSDMVDNIKHMGVGNDVGRRKMAALTKTGQRRRRYIMTAATKRPLKRASAPAAMPCTMHKHKSRHVALR